MRKITVKSGSVSRGTSSTVIYGTPSFGILVYDPAQKVGYFADVISEVSFPKEIRAKSTCEPLFKKIKKDGPNYFSLYSVLVGDSIADFEFTGSVGEAEYATLDEALRDHNAYRQEVVDELIRAGFDKSKMQQYFVQEVDHDQDVTFDTYNGDIEIIEYDSLERKVSKWISIRDQFRTVEIR